MFVVAWEALIRRLLVASLCSRVGMHAVAVHSDVLQGDFLGSNVHHLIGCKRISKPGLITEHLTTYGCFYSNLLRIVVAYRRLICLVYYALNS